MTNITRRQALSGLAASGVAPFALAGSAAASAGIELTFMTHAMFFSRESHQKRPLDPQAFVFDAHAPAAMGPQGIHHVAGYRPAWIFGPHDMGVFNADGKALGFTLADWFAAHGTVRIAPAGAGARVACRFARLRPNGVYSLFENHFDQKPIGFTPLDGTGRTSSFVADANGQAHLVVHAPHRLTPANAVLLVYHSDNKTHGMQRGQIGVTAHHQLIARVPA
ncbi:MAG: hypothetical protein KGL52_03925 [Rhodospirillales bacterium]|jgi:hypothetical protein|nr:hypothetical protein [Rhodospirillales bacterium]